MKILTLIGSVLSLVSQGARWLRARVWRKQGRRDAAYDQFETAREAQARMDEVAASDRDGTVERLRDGKF